MFSNTTTRLNKYISETGVCSRREADKWIEAGRVTCNGQPAALGTRVGDTDEVRIDGELIGVKKQQIYIALNKPVGVTSTQAVARLKRLFNAKKVGHAGTLDPLASGVLPVAFGEATKTVSVVQDGAKAYAFVVRWGAETDTDDAEGKVVAASDARPTLADPAVVLSIVSSAGSGATAAHLRFPRASPAPNAPAVA